MNIINIRQGGNVKRFHTVTMLREHLVSSHSWGVATILFDIYEEPSIELIKAALYHDVAEYITGDVSAPTKWRYRDLAERLEQIELEVQRDLGIEYDRDLTDNERTALKFADMADLVLACHQEVSLGNREASLILNRGMGYLREMLTDKPCRDWLQNLIDYINGDV